MEFQIHDTRPALEKLSKYAEMADAIEAQITAGGSVSVAKEDSTQGLYMAIAKRANRLGLRVRSSYVAGRRHFWFEPKAK